MAIPRANLGGMFGSGMTPRSSPQIDIAGAINAAVGGASSLIHNAYLRKVAERNYKNAQAQQAFERQRQTAQDARQAEQDALARARDLRDYNLKVEEARQKALSSGIEPATTKLAKPDVPVPFETGIPPIASAPTVTPERYNPARDVGLQRTIAAKGVPTASPVKSPSETPGTPEYYDRIKKEAEIRARAVAANRAPPSTAALVTKRTQIKREVETNTEKYIQGDLSKSVMPMDSTAARVKALKKAATIHGDAAVLDAMGFSTTPQGTPVPLRTPGSAEAARRADHQDFVARVRASGRSLEEQNQLVRAANQALADDLAQLGKGGIQQ